MKLNKAAEDILQLWCIFCKIKKGNCFQVKVIVVFQIKVIVVSVEVLYMCFVMFVNMLILMFIYFLLEWLGFK